MDDVGVRLWGGRLSEIGGDVGNCGDEGDGAAQERGKRRRLESSLPSLNSSTSYHLFLIYFASGVQDSAMVAGSCCC